MAIAKTIEIVASSAVGVEAAVKAGVAKVSETVKNIQGVWVKDVKGVVSDGAITEWRVTMAVTFVVD
ncbi:MAG: dodecin domain-containing protein [Sphingobium sp.]|nr:dodecin domain-containing protein [Sphingobium sp.]